ncbi:amidohydrolase family protein [Rhodococcus sp. P1Y]|uniref:amidohydrolase family protein n=1 Tax=Rhodococcus sp. P1Y TaxID=1302308 RepID=UPI000EB46AE4|nr:amidohydrolase family protein [Rhodococcus sp. P1Y]AYJ51229.1 2-pyrone-4,6-dicarboxylate hydrolase [Rhodococcus sp. P1Y]
MLSSVFDAHRYILDPRFPLVENQGYPPEPYTIEDYERDTDGLGITGGAVISSSFHTTDQAYLVAALEALGPSWVGVAQLDPETTDEEILRLDDAGVRAIRLNLKRGATDVQGLTAQARQAHDLVGWHAELYVEATMLLSLEPILSKLPAVSIDHLGMSHHGLPYLLDLVDRGVRVKASGFGRVDMDIADAIKQIHHVNPTALMFGTDLPGTRAPRRFLESDIDLVAEAVGGDLPAVLGTNARAWYRVK